MTASDTGSGVELLSPLKQSVPVVFASPHSGQNYTQEFLDASRLSPRQLRRSEDSFIDEVFSSTLEFGAPLLRAHFPRAYVDPNRSAYELDPKMFEDELPNYVTTKSIRIAAGLGTVPRVVASGAEIYPHKLKFEDAKARIERHYIPYHKKLAELLRTTSETFGIALLIDCHSMPSTDELRRNQFSVPRTDIVLGDCNGTSCHPAITDAAETICKAVGLQVARNKPYAGGYTTQFYGTPKTNVHTLQIEINRSLYMDELRIERGPGLATLTRQMRRFINAMTSLDFDSLGPGYLKAAE